MTRCTLTQSRNLYKPPSPGDISRYYEVHCHLPRRLQGLKTAMTIAKILEHNSQLKPEDWSTVMADVASRVYVLTTFSEKRCSSPSISYRTQHWGWKINRSSRTKRPNNQHFIDLLMPIDQESRRERYERDNRPAYHPEH